MVLISVIISIAAVVFRCSNIGAESDRALIEKNIRASIGWAITKDSLLLASVTAQDSGLFMFQPDSKSTIVGWYEFEKQFEFWMNPKFKATHFDINELRISISRSGDVAWFSAILNDLGEWDGRPIGWKDTRWTGVLEKRDGRWLIVQMHFSLASDKVAAEVAASTRK